MRRNKYLIMVCLFLIAVLSISEAAYAQKKQNFDSIIKANTALMYKNPDKAIATGLELIKATGDNIDAKIRAYKLVSDGYSSKRDYEKSLEYVIKANELLPRTNNKLLKISIVAKTGIQYHQLKIYDKAIKYLDEAEQLCMEFPHKDSIHGSLGVNYIVRGFIYKDKLNCDIAISFFDKGINELLTASKIHKNLSNHASSLSIAKYNKGNCYLMMSDNKLAIKNFEESIYYAKVIKANSLQAFAQKGLSQVYSSEGNYNGAITILNDALRISKDVDDLVLNEELYRLLSVNYLALNKWDQYQDTRLKYLKNQTDLMKRERKSVSESLNEKENQEQKNIENCTSKFWGGITLLVLVLVFVILFFVLSIKKTKVAIAKLEQKISFLQNDTSDNGIKNGN
ncbi:tetratricopeptide repeat protein [Flavobacterium sp. SM15]|uniref:tetratricopeptide repeat protein n=1 Tax=Flavobacterium sp. SM15 TaxID=2908005 RepID=UPI001EDC6039|nr:tetratricopeptide repeat protein [Flavobacterium sp. SM15]MCG2611732.1 tetratricopeptide repeat protein [Flavobacterium sp. SM15]